MSEQVPQSFGAITATNALAGNYFYGDNNITYNAGLGEMFRSENSGRTGLIDGSSLAELAA